MLLAATVTDCCAAGFLSFRHIPDFQKLIIGTFSNFGSNKYKDDVRDNSTNFFFNKIQLILINIVNH